MNSSAFSAELKVVTPIGVYRLPVVTWEAEPHEGGGIAGARIVDPKVYPRYTNAPMTVLVQEGTVVTAGVRCVKIYVFFLLIVGRFGKLFW